jgi:opacity protein-like surface antigen
MKAFSAGALSFVALLSAAQANFDVYWVQSGGNGVGGNFFHYSVTRPSPPARK